MDIQIFICNSSAAVENILADLGDDSELLYRTPGSSGESGEVLGCRVTPPRGQSETLDTFADKFIVVARRD